MARKEVVLFPELVEREIKSRVQAASPKERKWMLEAMSDEEIQNEAAERVTMHAVGENAVLEVARKIEWRNRAMKWGIY